MFQFIPFFLLCICILSFLFCFSFLTSSCCSFLLISLSHFLHIGRRRPVLKCPPASYLKSPGFRTQARDWMRFFVVFFSPFRQMPRYCLKLTRLSSSKFFLINYALIITSFDATGKLFNQESEEMFCLHKGNEYRYVCICIYMV